VDLEVSGQAYLIVRGSSGMGAAAAQVLAATGAHVSIFGRGRTRRTPQPGHDQLRRRHTVM